MNSLFKITLCSLIFSLFFITDLNADNSDVGTTAMNFLKINKSVKAESIGNALTAGIEINALDINPASIAKADQIEINLNTLSYIEDINMHNLNAILPTNFGNFGLNISYIDLGTQIRTSLEDREGANGSTFSNSGYQVMGVYAINLDKLNLGVGLKYLSQNLDNTIAQSMGLDLGTNYQLTDNLIIGVALNNLTLKKVRFVSTEQILPQTIRFGLLYTTSMFDRPLILSSDVVMPNDGETYFGIGAEYQVNNVLHLRTGYNSYTSLSNLAFGLGLALDNLTMDFNYKPYIDFGPAYRLGFGLKL
jgi:predicted porin